MNYMKINPNSLSNIISKEDPCPICIDPLIEENKENQLEVVAHEGEGIKHPLHLKCLEGYFEEVRKNTFSSKAICPNCRTSVIMPSEPLPSIFQKINTIIAGTNLGLSTFYLLAGKVTDLTDLTFSGDNYNLLFLLTGANAIKHLYSSENKFGAIVGASIGIAYGTALVASTASFLIDEENQEDFSGNIYDINAFTRLTIMLAPAIGMGVGEYVSKRFFRS